MTEYHIPKVHSLHASTEVPSGPPLVNWKEMDNFDPHWIAVMIYFAIGCLVLRLSLWAFGFFGTCWFAWMFITVASYGVAGFMINPLYCIIMSFFAGGLTWLALTVLSEIVNAPGRIWWKLTR